MDNVLNIKHVFNSCTGCGVCAAACPEKCINIKLNPESYFRPVVNEQCCTYCGKCVEVCYKVFDIRNPDDGKHLEDCRVYSAIHRDDVELQSVSSGGVAGELGRYCYSNRYDVIGALMDPQKDYAEHIVAGCEKDLEKMKKSKYVQSYSQNAFSKIRPDNKTLIIGLPCQIYGLRKYIQLFKSEDNFILVDLFCRGVPASNLFKKYREYLQSQFGLGRLVDFNFRSKKDGWHKFSLIACDEFGKEYSKTLYDDMYMSFYLKNSCFNESCYYCEFRHGRVFSDIRLGDFWGSKYYNHDEGVSIVSIYSQRGQAVWDKISNFFTIEENDISELKKSQRFDKFPIPEYRMDLLEALSSEDKLDAIHERFGISKIGFYNDKKKE